MFGAPWRLISYGAVVVAVIGLLWGVHHHGVTAGKTERDAYWQPAFLAAEKAAAEANARTVAIESAQTAATAAAEARHADQLKAIDTRAADYQRRYSALLVRFNAVSTRREPVPALAGSAADPPVSTGSDERVERAAGLLADIGRRCERDAERLAGWQRWYAEQAALNLGR